MAELTIREKAEKIVQDILPEKSTDPAEIFPHFCMEEIGEAPDEHLTELFLQAVKTAEEEDAQ